MRCVVCGAFTRLGAALHADGWEWFTGYFDRTAAFCPKHCNSGMRHLLYEFAQRKPSAPDSRWSLDHAARDLKLTVG
jgi:hypothetical protein